MKRGAIKKSSSRLINVWFPETLLPCVDAAVQQLDTDRSKFIRIAVREKMQRAGMPVKEEAA